MKRSDFIKSLVLLPNIVHSALKAESKVDLKHVVKVTTTPADPASWVMSDWPSNNPFRFERIYGLYDGYPTALIYHTDGSGNPIHDDKSIIPQ